MNTNNPVTGIVPCADRQHLRTEQAQKLVEITTISFYPASRQQFFYLADYFFARFFARFLKLLSF
jgi:hypothetical protein